MNSNNVTKRFSQVILLTAVLAGCSAAPNQYKVPKSKLAEEHAVTKNEKVATNSPQIENKTALTYLDSLKARRGDIANNVDETSISSSQTVSVATQQIKVVDFIHQSFDLLGLNYVVDDTVSNLNGNITLNARNDISKREYYRLMKGVLDQQGARITFKEGVYYIHPKPNIVGKDFVVGVGSSFNDVPQVDDSILQIIPLAFGSNINIERTINELTKAKVGSDLNNNTIFVEGNRAQVLQAIELVNMMDMPANRGKHIAFLSLTYLPAEDFSNEVIKLLKAEGIPASSQQMNEKSVVILPFKQVGGVAIFAAEKQFVERVSYWAKLLDVAPKGPESRYFIYNPKYARASELGESLQPLFGGGGTISAPKGNDNRDTKSALGSEANNIASVSGDLKMVVDQRSNVLIFETTGSKYQSILPLVKRLDTLPRQVILEATIAEVTLVDEFKYGVEFNLADGKWGFSTEGGLGLSDIAGASLNYTGTLDKVNIRALRTNSLVNVLSNPTILVRDGTSASITVGNEIPIVSSVDTNDETNVIRRNVQRTQTGLNLNVTPTINTEGVVTMVIEQSISSVGQGGGENVPILKRDLKTEVVANSGQTIIIGGLVSENASEGDSKVPFFGDIPVLGNLFKSKGDKKEKTELIILVTPKIITDEQQWYEIKKNFQSGLENVTF